MSVAAILWTHNEPDVLIPNIRYLLGQVDEVLVRDRQSSPDVRAELEGLDVILSDDDGSFGHDQSAIMSDLAREAMQRGHEWVVPIDPDEIWYANGRPLREALGGMARDVGVVSAELYNHVASSEDPRTGSPFQCIGYRQRYPLPLPKVAARTRPDLVIEGGNHYVRTNGVCLRVGPMLVVRHFPYRSEDQFVEKVRSNWEQLKASNMPEGFGVHIRAYGRCLDEEGEGALRDHFRYWFYSSTPKEDDSLIYDPAPM